MNQAELSEACRKYKNYDLKKELEWTAYNNAPGHMSDQDCAFISWLCYAALQRIKQLEADSGYVRNCPFCGGELHLATIWQNGGDELPIKAKNYFKACEKDPYITEQKVRFCCPICKISSEPYDTPQEAIDAWNKRSAK